MEEDEEGGRCRLSELAARARLSASIAGVMGPKPRFCWEEASSEEREEQLRERLSRAPGPRLTEAVEPRRPAVRTVSGTTGPAMFRLVTLVSRFRPHSSHPSLVCCCCDCCCCCCGWWWLDENSWLDESPWLDESRPSDEPVIVRGIRRSKSPSPVLAPNSRFVVSDPDRP